MYKKTLLIDLFGKTFVLNLTLHYNYKYLNNIIKIGFIILYKIGFILKIIFFYFMIFF